MSIRIERLKERRRKIIKTLICLILVVSAALFLRFGCRLTTLEITGSTYYDEEALKSWICDEEWDRLSWFLYMSLRFGEVPAIPFVETMEVEYVDLHTLHIQVYEKDIVGCMPYMGEYVCFDKDGIMVGSITEQREDVPVITGIEYARIIYNEQMDTPEKEIFRTILNVTQLIQKYEVFVDQIDFNHDREITLYIGDVRVLLGKREQYDEVISVLPGILEEAEGLKGVFHMKDYSQQNQKVIFMQENP